LRCRNPRRLKAVKSPGNTFDLNPIWARTLPLEILQGMFIDPHPILKLTFDTLMWAWVQKPTQGIESVKGPGNTFEVNPMSKTLGRFLYLRLSAGCQMSTSIYGWGSVL
jgi:hypothetical protein